MTFFPVIFITLIVVYATLLMLMNVLSLVSHNVSDAMAVLADALHVSPHVKVLQVHFVVPSKLPEKSIELDVMTHFTNAMKKTHSRHEQIIMTLQEVWNPSITEAGHRSFSELLGVTGGGKVILLRIRFNTLMSRTLAWPQRKESCVFYRLMGLEDPFMFPPYPVKEMSLGLPEGQGGIKKATLVLQHSMDGRFKRQYSCVVTPQLMALLGPKDNFYSDSSAGNQLDPAYIVVLLEKQIFDLIHHAREQIAFETLEVCTTAVHRKASRSSHLLSMRLRVMKTDNTITMYELDRYMPF
jgi:hypothetical protein